jgi:putative RecB family exonuclease
MLQADVGGVQLRGIIDRLELDADGGLVVTDYKTGKAPGIRFEQKRLAGVAFYSLLCERLLGKRPAKVRLLHLADPVAITTVPTDRSTRGVEQRIEAIWKAVERACERDDFRPNPSPRCKWCSFQEWCPAFGGDPALAPRPHDGSVEVPAEETPVAVSG